MSVPKILLVDDDYISMSLLEKVLNKEYDIEMAKNGVEGLEKVISFKPNLIVSDIYMPEMNGIQFTKELKNNPETRNIPILLITAFNIYKEEAEKSGCDGVFSKPIIIPKLKAKMREFLQHSKYLC